MSVEAFHDGEGAAPVDGLFADAFGALRESFPRAEALLTRGVALQAQTGHRFLLAWSDDDLVGAVEWGDDDGIAWFDLLVSELPGAGRLLVREVERSAQERGCRLVRCTVPDSPALAGYFSRLGYLPIGRSPGTPPMLSVEKRLPLLTVREQRRTDAEAIGVLTGEDPWPFTQGHRPGWFVLSDGDQVAGVLSVRDARGGRAVASAPLLAERYRGRALELWMLERAALYARTNGFHTIEVPMTPALDRLTRDLEERRWWPHGPVYRRSLAEEEIEADSHS